MTAIFRDTVAGYFIRFISGNKLLPYPEELPGFELPKPHFHTSSSSDSLEKVQDGDEGRDVEKLDTTKETATSEQDIESGILQPTSSQAIRPEVTTGGVILVAWYSTDDPANPYNWASAKKIFVCGQIWYDTLTNIVYRKMTVGLPYV
jgi:DHA1 family multidrug resistance protein-like MFS transporter